MLYEVAYYSDFIYINVYSRKFKIRYLCCMSNLSHGSIAIDSCQKFKNIKIIPETLVFKIHLKL